MGHRWERQAGSSWGAVDYFRVFLQVKSQVLRPSGHIAQAASRKDALMYTVLAVRWVPAALPLT